MFLLKINKYTAENNSSWIVIPFMESIQDRQQQFTMLGLLQCVLGELFFFVILQWECFFGVCVFVYVPREATNRDVCLFGGQIPSSSQQKED